jgi:hypothetical protein
LIGAKEEGGGEVCEGTLGVNGRIVGVDVKVNGKDGDEVR